MQLGDLCDLINDYLNKNEKMENQEINLVFLSQVKFKGENGKEEIYNHAMVVDEMQDFLNFIQSEAEKEEKDMGEVSTEEDDAYVDEGEDSDDELGEDEEDDELDDVLTKEDAEETDKEEDE